MTSIPSGIKALLDGPLGWYEFDHHPEIPSTNAEAAARIAAGRPAGVIIVADRQSAGRGRLDRSWTDVPGGSLLCSVTVPVPANDASLVPLVAGVAAADACKRAGARVALKWPNDILDDSGRKVGGILVERHVGAAQEQLVIGVGINLDWRGVERDEESSAWTSLAEITGADIDRWEVLADLLRGIDAWTRDLMRGTHRAIEAYTAKCATLDRPVEVTTPNGATLSGIATQLAKDGSLVIDTGEGLVVVSAGDVVHASLA